MKLLYSSLFAFLIGAAIAAPNGLERREPSNAPVNLAHALEDGEIKECGGNFYDEDQVYFSIQHAVNLQKVGETRGSMLCPSDLPFSTLLAKRARVRERLTDCLRE